MKRIIVILLYCYIVILFGCQNQPLYKTNRLMMGTSVEVVSSDKRAANIVFTEIKRIENLLSKYEPESEISKLNRRGKLNTSPDTFYIIKKAKDFWQISEGAFDITVGPLMDLWGFTEKIYRMPQDREIKDTLKLVGSDKIIFNNRNNMIKFKFKGMKIDLGAVAKGYAVDCAIDKLKKVGIKSALVNAGGDIYCLGDKFAKAWKVAIQNPRKKGPLDYLELKDKAVATSGDYQQYFIKDKKRYCHIFNPQTGYPVDTFSGVQTPPKGRGRYTPLSVSPWDKPRSLERGQTRVDSSIVSVTVIASDCLTADTLATSIFVLGKEKGEALAKKFSDVKVRIIEEKDASANR